MKVDKRNPAHWLWLALSGLMVIAGLLARLARRRNTRPLVLLYGHKLNGNLLALYRHHAQQEAATFDLQFLTMDPAYARALRAQSIPVCTLPGIFAVPALMRCACVVSDHGLHVLELALRFSSIRFADVWHGVPFKGFDADDFRIQQRYMETWVSSPALQSLYVEKFGFAPERVCVTGYARTDVLVRQCLVPASQYAALGIVPERPVVLFAPTWQQDDRNRSLYPFGLDAKSFMQLLQRIADAAHCQVLVRAHLNAQLSGGRCSAQIRFVPMDAYPDTESLLQISDVLVSDWSSIVFDYLLLNRPTLFLDVPAPFRKGFSLGPDCRFGPLIRSPESLLTCVRQAIEAPEKILALHAADHARVRGVAFGAYADGQASARCYGRLEALVRGVTSGDTR